MSDSTPGWQPDPTGKHDHRYWDGSQWTENVSDAGVASTDPYEPAAAAAPEPPAPVVDPTVVDPSPPTPDDTSTWPTAPAAPAPPPPYVPTGPVSPGGDGSKRRLLVGAGILAAVALVVVIFLSMSGDDEDDVRVQLAAALEREADLSESDAACVADFFVDDLGEDAFEDIDFDAANPPAELQQAFIESGAKAVQECNVSGSAFGAPTETTDPGGTTDDGDDGGGTGGDTGGFTDATDSLDSYEEILIETFETSLGLTRDQAECLAGEMRDGIEDGTLSQEEAITAYFDFFEACNIDPEEIGAN